MDGTWIFPWVVAFLAVSVQWQVAMTQCEVTSAGLYRDPDLATSCQCGEHGMGSQDSFYVLPRDNQPHVSTGDPQDR